MSQKEFFWCGEGDLNPHGIAPASTSSRKCLFRRVSRADKSMILRPRKYRPVSPILLRWLHFGYTPEGFMRRCRSSSR